MNLSVTGTVVPNSVCGIKFSVFGGVFRPPEQTRLRLFAVSFLRQLFQTLSVPITLTWLSLHDLRSCAATYNLFEMPRQQRLETPSASY
jgi:hypothetical protein